MSEILSVRIRRELKEEARRLGIDLRRVVERAIEEEILRAKKRRLRELLRKALESAEIMEEEWVEAVEEARAER